MAFILMSRGIRREQCSSLASAPTITCASRFPQRTRGARAIFLRRRERSRRSDADGV